MGDVHCLINPVQLAELYACMDAHVASALVQHAALMVLLGFVKSTNHKNAAMIGHTDGGVSRVLRAMDTHPASREVQRAACGMRAKVAQYALWDGKAALIECDAVERLVRAQAAFGKLDRPEDRESLFVAAENALGTLQ